MKRLLTAIVAVPLALLAIFKLPPLGFYILCAILFGLACWEMVVMARQVVPGGPVAWLLPLSTLASAALALPASAENISGLAVMAGALVLSVGVGTLVLLSRTPLPEIPASLGFLGFGILYLALPVASLCHLQRIDPWLVFLLVAIVWLGDTAAYYFGSAFGKHKLAPVVSPKKSWEGAAAGLVTSLIAAGVWSFWRLGSVELAFVGVAAATAITAQLGDLVESTFKRAAGVKDSSNALPGHGGFLDRADALLFAAPTLWVGILLLGLDTFTR